MIRCRGCGTENAVDAGYCSGCARKLDAETQLKVHEAREAHTATRIRFGMVLLTLILIVVVLLVVAVFVIHGV